MTVFLDVASCRPADTELTFPSSCPVIHNCAYMFSRFYCIPEKLRSDVNKVGKGKCCCYFLTLSLIRCHFILLTVLFFFFFSKNEITCIIFCSDNDLDPSFRRMRFSEGDFLKDSEILDSERPSVIPRRRTC